MYAGTPEGILEGENILRALTGVPIEFFNTAFCHNIFASAEIIFDELVFHVPFTAQSFAGTTTEPVLYKLNFVVFIVLFALLVLVRRPAGERIPWIALLAAWGLSFSFVTMLGRVISETMSQSRYAYFPTLVLVVVLAHLFEPYFNRGWSLAKGRGPSFVGQYGPSIVLLSFIFIIGLNTAKTSWDLNRYMEYRDYPNDIYYTARDWLSKSENEENSLFISATTYPSHEILAWGMDIVPDLFLDDPRITKDFQEATHILEWEDGQDSPSIRELVRSPEEQQSRDDFAITFGILAHGITTEDYLEVFGPSAATEPGGKQWWLRLDFEQGIGLAPGENGRARVVLGYSQGRFGRFGESWMFRSQPVSIRMAGMTHIVLLREDQTFGLIVNGKLVEKVPDVAGEDLRDIELPLGKFYQMLYRRPYYYAHTFVELGRSSFHIQDKEIGHVFDTISFNPKGFQEYHMTLGW